MSSFYEIYSVLCKNITHIDDVWWKSLIFKSLDLKGMVTLVSSVFSLLVLPGLGSLMGLVRGVFGFWVIGDSSARESVISGAGWLLPWSVERVWHQPCWWLLPWSTGGVWHLVLAGDNSSGLGGEFASASAVGDSCLLELELVGDSSSLRGRGMDTLWSVLTWGLLWSWVKAASLYLMGNLGLNTWVDAVDVVE